MEPAAALDLSQHLMRSAQRPTPAATTDTKNARKAAESFEAFFIGQYLEHMFAGIRTDGMFGGGQGEKIYRSMLMQEYGKALVLSGGIGIADSVQRSILQMQEQAQEQTR